MRRRRWAGANSATKTGSLHPPLQGFPKDVRQKRKQDMSLDPVFELAPDRADIQFALLGPKRLFDVGQLDVGPP